MNDPLNITTQHQGITIISSSDPNEIESITDGLEILSQLPPEATHGDLRSLVESEQRRIAALTTKQ